MSKVGDHREKRVNVGVMDHEGKVPSDIFELKYVKAIHESHAE